MADYNEQRARVSMMKFRLLWTSTTGLFGLTIGREVAEWVQLTTDPAYTIVLVTTMIAFTVIGYFAADIIIVVEMKRRGIWEENNDAD